MYQQVIAGSMVGGVDKKAIEQWENPLWVLLLFLCGDPAGTINSLGLFFFRTSDKIEGDYMTDRTKLSMLLDLI
jgi:hypothetical protein